MTGLHGARFYGSGSVQSTCSSPLDWRKAFAFEKCRQPKNPLRADNGEGCAAFSEVARRIDNRRFLLRSCPEHEHDRCGASVHLSNDGVGEPFPAAIAARRHGPSRQSDTVQKQHALLCPMFEKSVTRTPNAEIAFELFIDVHEAQGAGRRAAPRSTVHAPGPVRGMGPVPGSPRGRFRVASGPVRGACGGLRKMAHAAPVAWAITLEFGHRAARIRPGGAPASSDAA